ncbi:hypothetical protein [Nocardia sp. NPDC003963]
MPTLETTAELAGASMGLPGDGFAMLGAPDSIPATIDGVAVSTKFLAWMVGYNSRPVAELVQDFPARTEKGETRPRNLAELLLRELWWC